MKKYFIIFISILIVSCSSSKHYYKLSDGTWVSKKKYEKIFNKSIDEAIKKTSVQDLKAIGDFTIDTVFVNRYDTTLPNENEPIRVLDSTIVADKDSIGVR